MDHTYPWLKYVDAEDLDNSRADFDGLNVESPSGEHLGDVDGFIVDKANGRPYYVVVDAGGWFKSKEFLLPIGQARLDLSREVMVVDLSLDRINRFPGFDHDEFGRLSEDGIRKFNDETSHALTNTASAFSPTAHFSEAWGRPEFAYPDWWQAYPALPNRMGERAVTAGAEYGEPSLSDLTRPVDRSGEVHEPSAAHEAVVAREDAELQDRTAGKRERDERTERETEPSPHFDGRAQPGDVLGLETGGEQTHIGDTSDDENKRRRDAEKELRNKD
jgi:hypothetical protein